MKKILRLVAGFSLVINLLWLAPAMFSLQIFDRVLPSQSRETLLVLMIGLAVAFVLTGLLEYLRSRLQTALGNVIDTALSPEVARLTLAEAAKRQGPVSMEALRDVGRLRNLFSAQGLLAVLDVPWALIFLAVITLAHPWLGMAAAAAAVLMLGLALLNNRLTQKALQEVQRDATKAQRDLERAVQNAEVAQALGMGGNLISRWQQQTDRYADLQGDATRQLTAMSTFTRVMRQAVQVFLQALGAYLVLAGEASPGILIAATMLLGKALQPIEQIVVNWKVLSEGLAAYKRLDPLISVVMQRTTPMPLPAPTGQLVASGLVYRPPNSERVIIGGVSLQLEAGESLAILGPSGAGKSTLVRLLMGLWQPTSGAVRLDGVELAKWDREAIGPHIGYVPQDVELFAGTIGENIARMGQVSPSLVIKAAKLAGIHEMVLTLPEGYDTVIDPHSALLSQGQRQRIALARALYGHPKLIVLDEPNSNLDGTGELALAQTLKELHGQVTVVVVTHRAALTSQVDKIMVIEGGRSTQYGPARDVLQALQAQRPQGAIPMRPAGAAAGTPTIAAAQPTPLKVATTAGAKVA